MEILAVNWFVVIGAAIAKFVIGSFWYMPQLLGKQWQKAADITPDASVMPRAIAIQLVGDLIMAWVLAQFIGHAAATGLVAGAIVGLVAWLGFVATIMLGHMTFENRPMSLFAINAGYQLVGLVVMGGIIGSFTVAAASLPA